MKAVFFGEELHERAPHIIGMLCLEPNPQWVGLQDVIAAMQRNETITIRPASETEMKRAEGVVALYEIGKQLGYTLCSLLDEDGPEVAVGAVTAIRDAAESALDFKKIPTDLLDQKS